MGNNEPIKGIEEQKRIDADIVAMSTLMTTTMMAVEKAIPLIKSSDSKVFIMVGGAPFTQEIAEKFGADGYAGDAVGAVTEAQRLMSLQRD